MSRQQTYPIRGFRPVSVLSDTVDKGVELEQAQNILLRPQGGFSGPPVYDNLWAIGVAQTVQTTIRALTYNATTIGDTAPHRATNKTVAVQINRQGKHFLLFYCLTAAEETACRGFFYLGDDGTYTSGSYAFTTGTPTYTVLAVGMDEDARWHGYLNQGAWFLGNGVDANVIVQLGRTATPGIWRTAGTNVVPAAPVVNLITPATTTNVQASVTFTRGGQPISFTADPDNYPGALGNAKITIRLDASGVSALSSTLTGAGITLSPYAYTVNVPTVTGTAAVYTTNNSIATFVNTDSKAISLFTASGANSGADGTDYGPTAMSGGSGSGGSEGFTNRTVTIYARYWDPGHDSHGYEGPSSDVSNTVAIANNENKDLRLFVTPDAAAEGGRFPYIRLYMQFGEDAEAVWKLITPDSPVPNGLTDTFARYLSTNAALFTSPQWADNDAVRLTTTGTLPAGLSTGVDYYLRTIFRGTFTRHAGNNLLVTGSWNENAIVNLSTTGTLPAGLATGVDYYMRPRTGTLMRITGDEITLTGTGWADLDTITLTTTGTLPAGLSTGTTYYLRYFAPGQWRLSLTSGGPNIPMADAGSGTHTASATPATQWQLSLTSGGTGVTITSAGSGTHTITLKRVSSEIHFATTPDGAPIALTSAGSGTHTATLQRKCVEVGTTTVFGEDDMSADQNRPLPHKYHAFTVEQTFRAGLPDYPERLYASKIATADEIAPEGCSLLPEDYEQVSIPGTPAGSRQVTALIATEARLDMHTLAGMVLLNPADLSQRVYPQSSAGAINGSAVTLYEGKEMYYWGSDLHLRRMSTQRPGDFASTLATSQFAALGALNYLRQHLDPDAVLREPDRVFVFADPVGQHLWCFAPGRAGTQLGFAYDFLNKGMMGPFTYPRLYAACHMEPGRPEIVFADEAGRLFVWDTSDQMDSDGNAFGTQSAFTPHSTGTAMPAQYNGWGYVDYDHDQSGSASRFYQATECVLETAMIDFGKPAQRKAFQALVWRTITDSRAYVEVTFTNLNGETEVFTYGDVNDACDCRASLMLPGTACRVKLRVIGAERKKWAIRDLSVLWTPQGRT